MVGDRGMMTEEESMLFVRNLWWETNAEAPEGRYCGLCGDGGGSAGVFGSKFLSKLGS